MRLIPVQEPLKHLIQNESLEPRLFWGLRLGLATIIPLLWGMWAGRIADAEWIAFAAELLCWIELKGSLSQRFRLLVAALVVCLFTCLLGGLLGTYTWLAVIAMVIVGFVSGLIRNIGDRANGIAFVLNVGFIINLSAPFADSQMMMNRLGFTLVGGLIATAISFLATFLQPRNFPYRRLIANIWKETAQLAVSIKGGWDGISLRNGVNEIYSREMAVRASINNSLDFFDTLSTDDKRNEQQKHALAQLRKSASLVALHLISIADELEHLHISDVDPEVRIILHRLIQTTEVSSALYSRTVMDLTDEKLLLLENRLQRLEQILDTLDEQRNQQANNPSFHRIFQLGSRIQKIMSLSMQFLHLLKKDPPSYQSYSLIKTLFLLHPKYFLRHLKMLFNFNSFTTKYALRLALAAGLCVAIWKWWELPYGQWMAFTVAVLVQPYFRATLKKAIDRIIGTILGAVAGGILVMLPDLQWLQLILLFIASVLMVFYVRTKYSYAAFYMTIALILLFEMNDIANPIVIIDRATITAAGSIIAIVAGFVLLPYWDKKHLPTYLSKAIHANYNYFLHSYFNWQSEKNWLQFRQVAESANSNLFDSYNRYMQEPSAGSKRNINWYPLIIENIRITHELNNHQINQDGIPTTDVQDRDRLKEALALFQTVVHHLPSEGAEEFIPQPEELEMIKNFDAHFVEKIILELKALWQSMQDLQLHRTEVR